MLVYVIHLNESSLSLNFKKKKCKGLLRLKSLRTAGLAWCGLVKLQFLGYFLDRLTSDTLRALHLLVIQYQKVAISSPVYVKHYLFFKHEFGTSSVFILLLSSFKMKHFEGYNKT
jgi:hypothetical protein